MEQGKEGILKSRAIEDRLVNETSAFPNGYDLHPQLKSLNIPARSSPAITTSFPLLASTWRSIPGTRLVTLKDCGHFPLFECAAPLREQIDAFFMATSRADCADAWRDRERVVDGMTVIRTLVAVAEA